MTYFVSICQFVFFNFRYWNGLLVLLKPKERLEEMLMLILYLNDVTLLDNNQPNGWFNFIHIYLCNVDVQIYFHWD